MHLTIEISDAQAALLKARANAEGVTVERWVQKIAEDYVPSQSVGHLQVTNPREWARQFHEWAEGHDRTTPPSAMKPSAAKAFIRITHKQECLSIRAF